MKYSVLVALLPAVALAVVPCANEDITHDPLAVVAPKPQVKRRTAKCGNGGYATNTPASISSTSTTYQATSTSSSSSTYSLTTTTSSSSTKATSTSTSTSSSSTTSTTKTSTSSAVATPTNGPVVIDAYVHLLLASAPASPLDDLVSAKIAYLSASFAPWGFNFVLRNTTQTINPLWASGVDADKPAKLAALHQGRYQDVNIYLVENANSGVCSLPVAGSGPVTHDQLVGDGCLTPLSPQARDDSTVTHEVGHWMGLLHTFQGGCDVSTGGDFCDDTPIQESASLGKETVAGDKSTCPAQPQCNGTGLQNVKNFMDYTDCAQLFTPCQGGRMKQAWALRDGRQASA